MRTDVIKRSEYVVIRSIDAPHARGSGQSSALPDAARFGGYDANNENMLFKRDRGGRGNVPGTGGRQGMEPGGFHGWGGWIKGYAPDMLGAPRGNALFVFALPRASRE